MSEDGERRHDFELRAIVHEYERQAEETLDLAKRATDAAKRQKLISLANSFTELAEALRGPRPRLTKYSIPRYRIQFLNQADDIIGFEFFDADGDEQAIGRAGLVYSSNIGKGYEIWDGARRVHVEIY